MIDLFLALHTFEFLSLEKYSGEIFRTKGRKVFTFKP